MERRIVVTKSSMDAEAQRMLVETIIQAPNFALVPAWSAAGLMLSECLTF